MSRYRRVKRRVSDGTFVWAWEDIDKVTRIPDDYLKPVFYMSEILTEQSRATGFVVAMPCTKYPDYAHEYAITNRHVVMKVEHGEVSQKNTSVTINTVSHRRKTIPYVLADWHTSDDDDLAALPLMQELNNGEYDYLAVDIGEFLTQELARQHKYGNGNEVFYAGRFSKHEGDEANTPVMRFGRVSLYPETKVGKEGLILVEGLAIRGFSGSPFFTYGSVLNFLTEAEAMAPPTEQAPPAFGIRLLGILKGHWEEPEDDVLKYDSYNYGILAVIPAWRLKKFLREDEGLKKLRKNEHKIFEKAKKSKDGFVEDVEPPTKEEYMQALRKSARKINPSESDRPAPKER